MARLPHSPTSLPRIIQGGMGVAVSAWPLARAVSRRGQLGVVSGTGIDAVFARRLQLGDPGGHMRLAIEAFPIPEIAERVWARYFVPGGKRPSAPFKSKPVPSLAPSRALTDLTVVANFVEVFLAKRGHDGRVGLNLLEKIQLPTLPSLFGAMLAGVDVVLMGAGIPRAIPGVLDQMANLEPVQLRIDVAEATPEDAFVSRFDPREYAQGATIPRPDFYAIIASSTLAQTLVKRSSGRVDGFVVEGPKAGGHNAPPRGRGETNASGEPVYGPRDVPDLDAIRDLGLPFWMAGSYGSPAGLRKALDLGAQGIQVGTAFAFCDESGIDPEIKAAVVRAALDGTLEVRTDARASSTGFPFKLVQLPGTMADAGVVASRERICDLGFLRQPFRKPDGGVGFRCSAEPEEDYVAKGGTLEETAGRLCLCNGLLATAGFAQRRPHGVAEPAIVTAGDDVRALGRFVRPGRDSYTADDVIDALLAEP